jgi:hypothetical protein
MAWVGDKVLAAHYGASARFTIINCKELVLDDHKVFQSATDCEPNKGNWLMRFSPAGNTINPQLFCALPFVLSLTK